MAPMKRIELDSPLDFIEYREGSGGSIEIFDIAVGTERGKGRGTELVSRMLLEIPKDTKMVFAITRASNMIARQFYTALGFQFIGMLGGFYPTHEGNFENAIMYGLRR